MEWSDYQEAIFDEVADKSDDLPAVDETVREVLSSIYRGSYPTPDHAKGWEGSFPGVKGRESVMFNLACLLVAGVASVVAACMGEWIVAAACVFSAFGWAFCFHWWKEWRILRAARLWGWSRGPDSRYQLADDLEEALRELRPLIAQDGVVGEEPPPVATNVGPDIVRSVVKRLRQTRPRQKSDELLNVE